MKFFKKRKNNLIAAYLAAPDSKLIATRKSAIIQREGKQYLVYPKAMIKEVKIGSPALVYGYVVSEVIKTEGYDGLVVCVKK